MRPTTTLHLRILSLYSKINTDKDKTTFLSHLDQVDVVEGQLGDLEQVLDGGHGADAHDAGVDSHVGPAHQPSEGLQVLGRFLTS